MALPTDRDQISSAVVRDRARCGDRCGSARADQRVIVLLRRPRSATIERNAARIYAKWRVVPGFAATVDDAELQRLHNDPNVISIEPDLGGSVTGVSAEGDVGLNGELI